VLNRMDGVASQIVGKQTISVMKGREDWGVICVGYTESLLKDALNEMNVFPHILSLSVSNPLPIEQIRAFRNSFSGQCFLIEEGGVFVEQQLKLSDIKILGKANNPTITHWTIQSIKSYLEVQGERLISPVAPPQTIILRPPSICSGCPYRAIATAILEFKKKGAITKVFGDIGCSSLLSFEGVFDYSLCMGASESMRQGYVQARPDMASKVLSLIGDSSECHSGMDASRNSIYRQIPGVKIVLDNSAVAMTGYQTSPTSDKVKGISLKAALEGENIPTTEVDAYNISAIKKALQSALAEAEKGIFSAIIIKGSCLHISPKKKNQILQVNQELCIQCGLCDVCPSIDFDSDKYPIIGKDCTLCGSGEPLCIQACPKNAIHLVERVKPEPINVIPSNDLTIPQFEQEDFEGIFRLGVRGVGGQGNLFIGRVLAQVVQGYFKNYGNIYKGEVHGMAQMGGPVVSTFSFGNVHSPLPLENGLDVIISLERTELLRQDFISYLKPGGHIILSERAILPRGFSKNDYPSIEQVLEELEGFNTSVIAIPKEYETTENVYLLGVLSQFYPFRNIPESFWCSILDSFTKNKAMSQHNIISFINGRNHILISSGRE